MSTVNPNELAMELTKLRNNRDRLVRRAANSEGQLKAVMDELKEKYGCETLAQAQKRIQKLKLLCERKRTKYNRLLREAKHEQRKYDEL